MTCFGNRFGRFATLGILVAMATGSAAWAEGQLGSRGVKVAPRAEAREKLELDKRLVDLKARTNLSDAVVRRIQERLNEISDTAQREAVFKTIIESSDQIVRNLERLKAEGKAEQAELTAREVISLMRLLSVSSIQNSNLLKNVLDAYANWRNPNARSLMMEIIRESYREVNREVEQLGLSTDPSNDAKRISARTFDEVFIEVAAKKGITREKLEKNCFSLI